MSATAPELIFVILIQAIHKRNSNIANENEFESWGCKTRKNGSKYQLRSFDSSNSSIKKDINTGIDIEPYLPTRSFRAFFREETSISGNFFGKMSFSKNQIAGNFSKSTCGKLLIAGNCRNCRRSGNPAIH